MPNVELRALLQCICSGSTSGRLLSSIAAAVALRGDDGEVDMPAVVLHILESTEEQCDGSSRETSAPEARLLESTTLGPQLALR